VPVSDETRPPIPLSLAHRPVAGGLALPWANAELAGGGVDFRSPHTARYERAWKECLCQSCGNPAGPRAVLVCGPRQVLTLRFDEPPTCPPCAVYASRACPFVSGRSVIYPDRPRITEGHRGEKCFDPSCGCGGWTETDPEHSADMGGQPNLPWYACWISPLDYVLTAHVATVRCSDLGCTHQRMLINGAQLTRLPMKIQLVSEPGNVVARRTLDQAEAPEHAAAAIVTAGVRPAERSPLWDVPAGTVPMPAARPVKAPAPAPRRREPQTAKELRRSVAELEAQRAALRNIIDGESRP
jgi:hypothetical protein